MNESMPVLFVGHGSPMNAIEDNEFSRAWKQIRQELPTPRAILCISAHWLTAGVAVTAMGRPRTIHDFYGFPPELHAAVYPAPGAPELALRVQELLAPGAVILDSAWGLDHGAWSVLLPMYPAANIPVCQLSIDIHQPPAFHFELGARLKALRNEGVLILGSGNIVHNLGRLAWQDRAFDWATGFDDWIVEQLEKHDFDAILDYHRLAPAPRLAAPTPDHFYPFLYVLGASDPSDALTYYAEKVTYGTISMRCLKFS